MSVKELSNNTTSFLNRNGLVVKVYYSRRNRILFAFYLFRVRRHNASKYLVTFDFRSCLSSF